MSDGLTKYREVLDLDIGKTGKEFEQVSLDLLLDHICEEGR